MVEARQGVRELDLADGRFAERVKVRTMLLITISLFKTSAEVETLEPSREKPR